MLKLILILKQEKYCFIVKLNFSFAIQHSAVSLNLCLFNVYLIDNLLQIVVALRVKSYVHVYGQVVKLTSLYRNHLALSKFSAVRKPGPGMKVSPTNVFSYKYLQFSMSMSIHWLLTLNVT